MGALKAIIAIAVLMWFMGQCNDLPEWAEVISFALVFCGFVAHKED